MRLIDLYNDAGKKAIVEEGSQAHETMVRLGFSPPEDLIMTASGSPFASEGAASTARTKGGMTETHDIVEVQGGFALSPVETSPALEEEPTNLVMSWEDKGGANTYIIDNGLEASYEPSRNPDGPGWVLKAKS